MVKIDECDLSNISLQVVLALCAIPKSYLFPQRMPDAAFSALQLEELSKHRCRYVFPHVDVGAVKGERRAECRVDFPG